MQEETTFTVVSFHYARMARSVHDRMEETPYSMYKTIMKEHEVSASVSRFMAIGLPFLFTLVSSVVNEDEINDKGIARRKTCCKK